MGIMKFGIRHRTRIGLKKNRLVFGPTVMLQGGFTPIKKLPAPKVPRKLVR